MVLRHREEHWKHLDDLTQVPTKDRDWHSAGDPIPEPGRFAYWPCVCQDVKCGTVFVLDSAQVRELLGQVKVKGEAQRWHPDEAAVERSVALSSRTHISALPGQRIVPISELPRAPIRESDLRAPASACPGRTT